MGLGPRERFQLQAQRLLHLRAHVVEHAEVFAGVGEALVLFELFGGGQALACQLTCARRVGGPDLPGDFVKKVDPLPGFLRNCLQPSFQGC